jgi:hypothetical protein
MADDRADVVVVGTIREVKRGCWELYGWYLECGDAVIRGNEPPSSPDEFIICGWPVLELASLAMSEACRD